MNTSSLVQKVWNLCHILRPDGVGCDIDQIRAELVSRVAVKKPRGSKVKGAL